jgi:hypothetical protein
MAENWYALFLSIVKNISPDKAIGKITGRCVRSSNTKNKEAKYIDDPQVLMKLKETHTYKEIANMYGTYPGKIFFNIKNYKQSIGC